MDQGRREMSAEAVSYNSTQHEISPKSEGGQMFEDIFANNRCFYAFPCEMSAKNYRNKL